MRVEGSEDVCEAAPLSQQEEWRDVTPIPQDDGKHPICPIAYTDDYREMMDYLRAVMAKEEISERALELTGRVIQANPGHYTVWVYRKRLVEELNADIAGELNWVSSISAMYPKNYQLWHHREALIVRLLDPKQATEGQSETELLRHPVIRRELQFLDNAINEDSKNFHAWSYRQWLVSTYNIWEQELIFVNTMINEDVRNNSAWNQRYFVILQGRNPAQVELDSELVSGEIVYTVENIKFAPNNESPWSYIIGLLLRHAPGKLYTDLLPKIQTLANNKDYSLAMTTTQFYWSALVDIYEQQARELPEQGKALLEKAQSICHNLAIEHDPMHGKYWEFRSTSLSV
ncbi:protein prenylyltransferase [Coemansia reversa NRRL 1564]|uniref:Protein farnesyltransferase/geranylgeranyltransferase type-1 subunit alpha n=1 Tax=Coemansia reversa (strain ATCC 12441 / NRRL 1564) TaxID=763665 RepID=A0A2G5BDF6_COERN|nr:protein prenylyltransferase [Coemansia reversa NRRL 1564]|eukprot:PIA17041.1 protein prenylyltransferase [Coemansia reversa NRRL 1564]